jgi:hypothetical protein
MNCGFPRLDFSEDSVKVRAITGEKFHSRFIGKGLPSDLNIKGKSIRVLISKLKPEESFVCLTWGPNYPQVKILNATARDNSVAP